MSQGLEVYNDGDFEEKVLKSTLPVLVDFWAECACPAGCSPPPSKSSPKDYAGKGQSRQTRHRRQPGSAIKFSINSIPTVILFKDGQVHKKFVGLRPEKDFKEALDAV